MRTRSAEAWAAIVSEAGSAGVPHSEIAKKHGVSVAALKYHLYKGRGEAAKAPRVLPVRVAGEAAVVAAIGAVRISFRESCDPAYVAAVLSALGKC